MIQIDGSQGEGGGQILRSSLALSMATGTPFRIGNIRAGREKPGLMRQHLTCVQAAAAICGGSAIGASVGSRELEFVPGAVRAGEYHFPIGTAGSTTMVVQAILPALLRADGASRIIVEGGTHNTQAPPFEFMARTLFPVLSRAGVGVRARLERHGFYPAGGGRIVVEIDPTRTPRAVELMERGERRAIRATALVSRLPQSIGRRELDVLRERLDLREEDASVVQIEGAASAGNALLAELEYEHITEVVSCIGRVGKSAESVARDLERDVRRYFGAGKPVGEHLADQLMVPLAVLAGGRFAAGPLSEHATTNMATLAAFGGEVRVDDRGVVHIRAMARS